MQTIEHTPSHAGPFEATLVVGEVTHHIQRAAWTDVHDMVHPHARGDARGIQKFEVIDTRMPPRL
jgi:hypothetical protein